MWPGPARAEHPRMAQPPPAVVRRAFGRGRAPGPSGPNAGAPTLPPRYVRPDNAAIASLLPMSAFNFGGGGGDANYDNRRPLLRTPSPGVGRFARPPRGVRHAPPAFPPPPAHLMRTGEDGSPFPNNMRAPTGIYSRPPVYPMGMLENGDDQNTDESDYEEAPPQNNDSQEMQHAQFSEGNYIGNYPPSERPPMPYGTMNYRPNVSMMPHQQQLVRGRFAPQQLLPYGGAPHAMAQHQLMTGSRMPFMQHQQQMPPFMMQHAQQPPMAVYPIGMHPPEGLAAPQFPPSMMSTDPSIAMHSTTPQSLVNGTFMPSETPLTMSTPSESPSNVLDAGSIPMPAAAAANDLTTTNQQRQLAKVRLTQSSFSRKKTTSGKDVEAVNPSEVVPIFVGNMDDRVSEVLIRNLLGLCGTVHNWRRVQSPQANFGFCDFGSAEAACRAVRLLDGLTLGGKTLNVKIGNKNPDRVVQYKRDMAVKLGLQPDAPELKENKFSVDRETVAIDEKCKSQMRGIIATHREELAKPAGAANSTVFIGGGRPNTSSSSKGGVVEVESFSNGPSTSLLPSAADIKIAAHLDVKESVKLEVGKNAVETDVKPANVGKITVEDEKRDVVTEQIQKFRQEAARRQQAAVAEPVPTKTIEIRLTGTTLAAAAAAATASAVTATNSTTNTNAASVSQTIEEKEEAAVAAVTEKQNKPERARSKTSERRDKSIIDADASCRRRKSPSSAVNNSELKLDDRHATSQRSRSRHRSRGGSRSRSRSRSRRRDKDVKADAHRRQSRSRTRSRSPLTQRSAARSRSRSLTRDRRSNFNSSSRNALSPGPEPRGSQSQQQNRETDEERQYNKRLRNREKKQREIRDKLEAEIELLKESEDRRRHLLEQDEHHRRKEEKDDQRRKRKLLDFLSTYDDDIEDARYFGVKEIALLCERFGKEEISDAAERAVSEERHAAEERTRAAESGSSLAKTSSTELAHHTNGTVLRRKKSVDAAAETAKRIRPLPVRLKSSDLYAGVPDKSNDIKDDADDKMSKKGVRRNASNDRHRTTSRGDVSGVTPPNVDNHRNNAKDNSLSRRIAEKHSIGRNTTITSASAFSRDVDDEENDEEEPAAPTVGKVNSDSRDTAESPEDDGEDDSNRKRSTSDDTPNADQQQAPRAPGSFSSEKEFAHNLIRHIPNDLEGVFDWELSPLMIDHLLIDKKIRPWVDKKMTAYFGSPETDITEYVCKSLLERKNAHALHQDVSEFLEDEAPSFMLNLWRKLIYEVEARKHGFGVALENKLV